MAEFTTILTNTGLSEFANAIESGSLVSFSQIAVGDSNGSYYTPTKEATQLKNERWRGAVTSIHASGVNKIEISTVIPANIPGGYYIREIGIYNENNKLLAIGKVPESFKPDISSGSTKDLNLKIVFEVSNTDVINMSIDPNVSIASNKYVQEQIEPITQQLAQTEQKIVVTEGEISVLQFGADKTGASNDTEAFRNAVNYARQAMIESNFSESVTVVLNGGIYNIDERIVISPFVKLVTKGFVVIKSHVIDDSTFHFTGQVGDPTFFNIMDKQQYQRGKFIDASCGGMLITHVEEKLPGTMGIEIGSRTDIGRNFPTSRYAISDVAITRFECGLQMNRFNNYIGVFERLHVELNTVNVRFGTTISSVSNSGENFNFYGCLFAGAERGFDWYVDGMDCNFYGCSFDFIDNLFYLRRGWKKIGIFGGHIEGISNKICTFTEGGTSGLRPTLTIESALIYCNEYNLFSGEIMVTLSSVRWARSIRQPNMYVASDDVNLSVVGNFSRQGLITTLSRQLNKLSNPRFEKVDTSGGDIVEPFSNYSIAKFGFSQVVITNSIPSGSSNTKAMKFTPIGTSNTFINLTLEKVLCNPGQNVEAMVNIYQTTTAKTVHFTFYFYDDEDNLISSTSPFSNNGTHAVNTWYSVKSTTINIAPPRTKKVSVRITLGDKVVGEDVYIDEFYLGVI